MNVSKIHNILHKDYSQPQKPKNKTHKNSIANKTEAMILAYMISLAALGNCDIESTDSYTKDVNLVDKEDKTEQLLDYQDEYKKRSQVIYSSVYGRIRLGNTAKGYKEMTTLSHKFTPIVFEKPLQLSPFITVGKIYKYNLGEGTPISYLLDTKDKGDATFNRVAALGINAEYLGFYVKVSSTQMYSEYREEDMFSHAGAVGYKHNLTDKLALDVAFNNDFTRGKGAVDGKEYNRSLEGGINYKISDNANIKMNIQKTIKQGGGDDIECSASFHTTF